MDVKQEIIQEGKAKIFVYKGEKISKELPVFYNPSMEENRTIAVSLLNAVDTQDMQIALPLEASGVRGIRFVKELKKGKIKSIEMNDFDENAVKLMKQNLKLNKLTEKQIKISKKDANLFLLESTGFDYIDIDPFGSPNPFLDSAIKRLARNGILAVTATDTSALSGTFPEACKRKYFAKPMLNELKHEIGIRILIRKVQLIAAQLNKALLPIYSYSTLHYFRVYFRCTKGKTEASKLISGHKYFLYCNKCLNRKTSEYNYETCSCGAQMNYAGPLWAGELWDKKLAQKIESGIRLADIIKDESKFNEVGYYDLHEISKTYKKMVPRKEMIISKLKKKKYKASNTHFSGFGVKTNANIREIVKLF